MPLYGNPEPGDRFELTERDLIVRGSLATYLIDLATANVRMLPAGKWLSFDVKPAVHRSAGTQAEVQAEVQAEADLLTWLPAIDDDEILHRVIVRAAILGNEERLASRKLLRQVRGGSAAGRRCTTRWLGQRLRATAEQVCLASRNGPLGICRPRWLSSHCSHITLTSQPGGRGDSPMTGLQDTESPPIRFRVLGPFEFYNGQRWTLIGSTKQRALLSLLVLNANRVRPSEQLISELWGDRFPSSVRGLLAGYVWRLRQLLGDDNAEMLVTRAPGYQLVLPPGAVDVHRYDDLSAAGHGQVAAEDLSGAVASFSAALALWRGNPFVDVPLMPSVMAETARLEESRLAVIEARIGAEIRLGRNEGLLPELKLIVAQFPLRERLHAHLMLVLYRSGQQAEALGAYRDLRRLLVEELGIEPSRPLRDLQQRILREDPSLLHVAPALPGGPVTSSGPVPTLPPQPRTFVGRDDALAMLTRRLSAGEPVCAIHGTAGAGKSALALCVAHAVAPHFPDGQLYLDLRGSAPQEPLEPAAVVGHLLHACGIAEHEVPASLDGAVARLHAQLASRRMLVVLDDVLDIRQLRPVLGLPRGSAVIIIGRAAQSAVEGPNQVRLGQLTAASATELLSRCVGPERIHVEPAAAGAIARLCEYLPLALRIAAVRLTLRPDWSLDGFAVRLADPQRRLDLLACEGLSVRASLVAAVRLVQRAGGPAALLALRLLGSLDLPVVSGSALSALLDLTADEAELPAASLVNAGLIEPLGIERYRVPQLVRLFARALAAENADHVAADEAAADEAAAGVAVGRVAAYYAAAVSEHLALIELKPHRGNVLAWYRREFGALCALAKRDPTGNLPRALAELRRALPTGQHGGRESALSAQLPGQCARSPAGQGRLARSALHRSWTGSTSPVQPGGRLWMRAALADGRTGRPRCRDRQVLRLHLR